MAHTDELKVVASDGVELAVTVHEAPAATPDAATVLLVHGYPDTSRVWDEVVDLLTVDHRVVTYDVRGAGASGTPASTSGYDIAQLADDLLRVADTTSPGQPVHVVGHDWGGIQAFEVACDADLADRIASLTVVSGASFDLAGQQLREAFRPSRDTPRALGRVVRQLGKSWYIGAFQLPVLPELVLRQGVGLRTLAWLEWMEPREGHPAATAVTDAVNGVNLYRANLRRVLRPRHDRVRVPLQVVLGDGDTFVSLGLFADLADRADMAFRRIVRGGHWLPRSHPGVVADAVRELVRHVDGEADVPALQRYVVAGDDRPLAGRVAVVTGGGNGIGRATSLALAGQGAAVAVADLDPDAAERVAQTIRDTGQPASAHQVDVTDLAAIQALAKAVAAEHGTADIVVNNAGIGVAGPFLDTSPDEWQRIVDVNLMGVVHGSRVFAGAMVEAGLPGHVVNLASGLAHVPARDMSAYCATKAAVLRLSEVLRTELADHGIGVSVICPGIVNTGITDRTTFVGVDPDEQTRRRSRTSAMYDRRAYPPEKVADAIVGAVRHNRSVVNPGPEAAAGAVLARLSPGLTRVLSAAKVVGR